MFSNTQAVYDEKSLEEKELSAMDNQIKPLLELKKITKRYPGVLALQDVELSVMPGEVHILFGENGAGKSTLISTIAGVQKPSGGELFFQGKPMNLDSVHQARSLGISAVFQEFSLIPQLTVEENLFLGSEFHNNEFLDKQRSKLEAKRLLDKLGFDIDPNQVVERLSRAEQQMVEIAKSFRSDLSILILDEPTASLTEKETNRLFEIIENLKNDGVGIIYITHRMSEIKKIGDRITVLRDGRYIDTVNAQDISENDLLELMTGRVINQVFPTINFKPTLTSLKIENLSSKSGSLKNVSINVKRGEVVGLAGLVGSGKSELLRACFGLEEVSSGKVVFQGDDVTGLSPRAMLDRGFFYNPPDRKNEGLAMMRSCRENMALSSLSLSKFCKGPFLHKKSEHSITKSLAVKLRLQPMNIEREVGQYSGGNQQKVLLAKCLTRDVQLYVFDEPTVGVDVGTRTEIYKLIAELCESGAAIVLISSDLPEIIHLSHRAYVMYRGELKAELQGDEITERNLLNNFFEKE